MKRLYWFPLVVTLLAGRLMAQDHDHGRHEHDKEKKDSKGEIRVYLADKDKKSVDLKDMTAMVVITPKDGSKKTLKTEVANPKGSAKNAIGHGGHVVEMDGYLVEFVVVKSHGDVEDATPYFKAEADLTTDFSAVVIFKIKGETKNAKGFQYPPAIPTNYSDAVAKIEEHLMAIDDLIKKNDLDKVHSVAEKISHVCEGLPDLASKNDRAEVEKVSKEIIALFGEIDEAADSGKKAETLTVVDQYRAKVAQLKKHQ